MRVSVIILNYNTTRLLLNCLESLVAQTHEVYYEVIVVDNASVQCPELNQLKAREDIIYVQSTENLGFGRANNLGLQYASGEYVLFLNSDTLLLNDAISLMYKFAEGYPGKLGALGCMLEDAEGNIVHSYGKFLNLASETRKYLVDPLFKAIHLFHARPVIYPNTYQEVDYITGADLFVNRSVLNECGCFNPAFFMYYEESELQWRFHQHGYSNILLRGPRIAHLEGGSDIGSTQSLFLRHNLRQEVSAAKYLKLTRPRAIYYIVRCLRIILRQTMWLYPHISFSDKIQVFKTLFYRTKIK